MTKAVLLGGNETYLQSLQDSLPKPAYDVTRAKGLVSLLADLAAPDLVLIDLSEDIGQIADRVARVRAACRQAAVVVLTERFCSRSLCACFGAGADAYLEKSLSIEALLGSIGLALAGEKVLPSRLAAMLAMGFPYDSTPDRLSADLGLSAREVQILGALALGDPNKVIASRLGISEASVRLHTHNLLRKIGMNDPTQAAIWSLNNGFAAAVPALRRSSRSAEPVAGA